MTHGLAMFNKRKKSKIDYHLNAAISEMISLFNDIYDFNI